MSRTGRASLIAVPGLIAALVAGLLAAPPSLGESERARGVPKCKGKVATLVGTSGPDRLNGSNRHRDVIVARGGNDIIDGGGRRDLICGGGGSDAIAGSGGNDRLYGQRGDDLLFGGGGKDRLYGARHDDQLNGQRGNRDLCHGGSGDNLAVRAECERIRRATGV